MKIIALLITGLISYAVIKVLRLGFKQLLNRHSGLFYLNKLLLITEFIIWIVYIVWASAFLFRDKFFYPYLVYTLMLIFAGFISWFLMRDIFAGVIFRISHNLKNGSFVTAGDITGQIRSQHLTYLKLQTDKGHLISIPYSRLMQEVITELAQTSISGEQVVCIKIKKALSISDTESLIKNTLLNNPWSNLKEEPKIKILSEDDSEYLFEIALLSINVRRMKFIRKGLAKMEAVTEVL
jgi:hypothetical protein